MNSSDDAAFSLSKEGFAAMIKRMDEDNSGDVDKVCFGRVIFCAHLVSRGCTHALMRSITVSDVAE